MLVAVLVLVGVTPVVSGATGGLALTAAGLRWSTTSLAAVAGAQAVLGPAVAVGSAVEAASAATAGAAALLAVPRTRDARSRLGAVVLGLVAATVTVAPAAGDGVPARLAALVAGGVAGAAMTVVPGGRARAAAGVVCGVTAVLLAALS